MDTVVGLVAFVMRSENRLEALRRLAEGPGTRVDLQEATDIPRATLSRILADFRRRDLVSRESHLHTVTPLGARLAAELEALFQAVEEAVALQTVGEWLPLSDLDVAIDELDDVHVTLPTIADPMAPVTRAADVVGTAECVRGFCYSVLHAPILTEAENVTRRGRTFEGVVARAVLEVIAADPTLAGAVRDLATAGRATLWVYDGEIGPQLIIADDVIVFLATDGNGAIQGLIETDDERIRPWAERTFTTYREAADRLDPDRVTDLLTS